MPTVTVGEEATIWAKRVCDEMRAFGHAKAVALWPQTCYQSREWPTGHWHDLAWGLRSHGIGSRFFLGTNEERWHNTPGFVFGMGWEKWAAMMLEADLNVAISSGPASLAAIARASTIVLEGPTKPTIWWHAPQIETMQVGTDRVSCVGCHFGHPFRSACDFGCFALAALTPDFVLSRVVKRLDVRGIERVQLHHWTTRDVGAPRGVSRTRRLSARSSTRTVTTSRRWRTWSIKTTMSHPQSSTWEPTSDRLRKPANCNSAGYVEGWSTTVSN